MSHDTNQVEIPYGLVEYTAFFEEPLFEGWERPALSAALLNVLSPYGFTLDGIEYKNSSEKVSERTIIFRRTNPPSPGMSLSLGLGKVVITAENLEWSEASRFVAGMTRAIASILELGPATLRAQQLALGTHVQISGKQRRDVTMPLLSAEGLRIFEGDVTFPGLILHVTHGHIIIDASAAFANALFVKLFREHPPEASLEELAEVLRRDEDRVFKVLGLEGTL